MGKSLEELLAVYKCHKVVKAVKVVEVHDTDEASISRLVTVEGVDGYRQRVRISVPASLAIGLLIPGCYYVVYEDGYTTISPAKAFEAGYNLIETEVTKLTIKLDADDPDPVGTVAALQKQGIGCSCDVAPNEFWETEKVQHILTTKLTVKRVIGTTEEGFGKVRLDNGEVAISNLKATIEDCIVYNPEVGVAFVRPAVDIGPFYKLNLSSKV